MLELNSFKNMLTENKHHCPFIDDGFEECYTSSLDNINMGKALRYCLGIYRECEFYINKTNVSDIGSNNTSDIKGK